MHFHSKYIGVVALLASSSAYAGAWTQDAGHGLAIVTADYYTADHFYNNRGHKQSEPTYSKYELNPYLEYGLWDSITAGANLSLQHAHASTTAQNNWGQNNWGQNNWGLGDSEFFLRKRLYQGHGWAFSAEPMIKLPSPNSSVDDQPRLGGLHPDAGMGLSAGYGFSAFGHNHFIDVDSQYRYRFGPPKDQVRLSATAGVGVAEKWTLLPQAFLTWRTSHPAIVAFTQSSADDYNEVKLQLSAIYQLKSDVSLQFGGFSDVAGKNAGAGNGVLFSMWKRL